MNSKKHSSSNTKTTPTTSNQKRKNSEKLIPKTMPKRSIRNHNQNLCTSITMNTEAIKTFNPTNKTRAHIIKIEYIKPDIKNGPVKPQNKNSFNHPITSFLPLTDLNSLNSSNDCTDRNIIRNILSSRTNSAYTSNFVNMNKSSRMIRCPFCKHDFSQEQLFQQSAETSRYYYEHKDVTINPITQKKFKDTKNKNKMKNFYLNEKGGVVFKYNTKPTVSIRIVKRKKDISKYINESKEFGKNKNISVYEVPISDTKVIVRPTSPIVY